MGRSYLADSNVLIDFLMQRLPSESIELLIKSIETDRLAVSVISKIEVLGYDGEEHALNQLRALLAQMTILPLDEAITDRTIAVRKSYKIKLPDAVIAATALQHDLELLTRNTKDFQRIDGLAYQDLHTTPPDESGTNDM